MKPPGPSSKKNMERWGNKKMTANEYLINVVNKYKLHGIDQYTKTSLIYPIENVINKWGGDNIVEIKLSGSRAKGTAISLASDLDLFISLTSSLDMTLRDIYNSLYNYFNKNGYSVRKQNVSIGLDFKGYKIDLVPAKRESQYGNDHSLYRRKADTWTKTNIDAHISQVRNSGRINEIIALKIWRENHQLEWPSIYLETFVINNLKGRSLSDLSDNIWYLLKIISEEFLYQTIVDPANSNNILSDELSDYEKKKVIAQAISSRKEKYWSNILR